LCLWSEINLATSDFNNYGAFVIATAKSEVFVVAIIAAVTGLCHNEEQNVHQFGFRTEYSTSLSI
jgi:hypothetical protein